MVGQELEEGWIYNGSPAKKFKKNRFFEDIPIEKLSRSIGDLDLLFKKYDETRVARVVKERKFLRRKDKEGKVDNEDEL
jgi:hypothetical protein